MNWGRCDKCHEYSFLPCGCKPFLVYYPEFYGEEKETVFGHTFEEVVERLAEKLNEDEPVFEENIFETPVEITDEDGETKRFNCTASISIDYNAEEVE
jgi:(2Fe-2S) ferredoxin